MKVAAVAVLVISVAACGSEQDEAEDGAGGAEPQTVLEIRVTDEDAEERWDLTCEPAGGDHPDPEAACTALAQHRDALSPFPPETACTQQYGGPQEATVEGTIEGERFRGTFSRRDGCEIARWEALRPLLVVRGGA